MPLLSEHCRLAYSPFVIIAACADWVERQPSWLRPPLLGVGFIYAFEISRGGLLLIPTLLAVAAWRQQGEFWPAVLILFVLAPAGGLLGGICYSAFAPLVKTFGAPGRFLQRAAAGFGYGLVLLFAISPALARLAHHDSSHLSVQARLGLAGVIAVGVGVALSYGDSDPVTSRRTDRRIVIGVVVVGAALLLLMYLAGWMS